MCKPAESNSIGPRHVVISGAGPAGLLLAALLLQRNDELPTPLYRITLIDNRQDLGTFSQEDLKKSFRSWMLGLASHGVGALKQVNDGKMYEAYCKDVGIQLESLSIHLGAKELKTTNENLPADQANENFIVDRNFIVASLARYLNDTMDGAAGGELTTLYEHKVQYVDYENQQILMRDCRSTTVENEGERYLSYDLLVGCDGARSVVREAMVKRHSAFEMEVGDIFQCFKAVHVQRPANVDPGSLHVLPDCFPCFQGIALPETGDMLNLSMGIPRHLFESDKIAKELKSTDPKVVAQHFKDNFKAFELIDYDDLAQQWVNQRWNRTAQVHCNVYHSTDINVVLMGDAAHATSPSIGMGMNQALKDAQTLYLLLQEHKDNLSMVLPAYSEKRVKEGNALSDLAMHLYCMEPKQQLIATLHMLVRTKMHSWFPSLVLNHPQALIGLAHYGLSDVYDIATRLGIMSKHRRINDKIRQDYFEERTGMVVTKTTSSSLMQKGMVLGSLVVAAGAVAYNRM